MDIGAMFKHAEPQAAAFSELLKKKTPPTDSSSRMNRFRTLELQARTLAEQAKKGHHLHTAVILIFLQGVALGLDVVTEQEIADVNKVK